MEKNQNRRGFLAVALAAIAAAAAYRSTTIEKPAPMTPARIAFVTAGNGPYWAATVRGAKAAAKDFSVDLAVNMPEHSESLEEQTSLLSQIDCAATDGVGVSLIDGDGQTALVNRIAEKTNVITFDSDAPDSNRTSYVGTGNFGAGRTAGRLLRDALPAGGKVVVLMANTTKNNMQDRRSGLEAALKESVEGKGAVEILAYLEDKGNQEKCAESIVQALKDHADLAGIVGLNAKHGPVLMKTLKDSEQLGKLKLITFDDEDETLAGIEQGSIEATIAQQPYQYGYETVRMLAALARGDENLKPISHSTYSVTAVPVTKDNVAEYRKNQQARHEAEAPAEKTAQK